MRHSFEYYDLNYSFKQAAVSLKNAPPSTPEEMAAVIHSAWRRKVISQKQVERDLGIHQSQFSKIVNGQFKGTNGHAGRLFEYSKLHENAAQPQAGTKDTEALRSSLTEQLMRAWDGTAEGAQALKTILDGAARLRVRQPRKA